MVSGQLDYQIKVIRLRLCLVRRFISDDGAAFFAFMNNDKAFFGVGFCFYRTENTAAVRSSVSRIDIKMKGAQTYGAVIA